MVFTVVHSIQFDTEGWFLVAEDIQRKEYEVSKQQLKIAKRGFALSFAVAVCTGIRAVLTTNVKNGYLKSQ